MIKQTIIEQLNNAKSKLDAANGMTEEANELLREAMSEARANLGLSAEKFGKLCGITQQYVFRIESRGADWSRNSINTFISNMEGNA